MIRDWVGYVTVFGLFALPILLLAAAGLYENAQTIKELQTYNYNLKMKWMDVCNATLGDSTNEYQILGRYNTNGYYCVNVEGRTMEEVTNTEIHELCHVLVHVDYPHFCGWEQNLTSEGN